jgi:hypothetical protein
MPSSSHTVGPLRAAKIFILDLKELGLLEDVHTLKITLYALSVVVCSRLRLTVHCSRYGSLAATGKGHMTPQALMMGFEGTLVFF